MNSNQATGQAAMLWSGAGRSSTPPSAVRSGRLASFSIPAPGLRAEDFLRQALGQPRVYWANGRDGHVHAGFGVAAQLLAWGPERFSDIHEQAAALFSRAHVFNTGSALAAPRLFGGFSFRDDFMPDNAWAVFHAAQFILPHFQLAQSGAESWLTLNVILEPDEALDKAQEVLVETLNARFSDMRALATNAGPAAPPPLRANFPLTYARWQQQIAQAIAAIGATSLEKVVLARVCEISAPERLDIDRALAFLNDSYPESTRFLFEPRPFHAFFGATPELLAQVSGNHLRTMALAGSAPRGGTATEDEVMRRQLLASAKDRAEHDLVVGSMLRRLADHTHDVTLPPEPEVYSLSYIHHLLTPIAARISRPEGVLPFVRLLHPTPALGGTPREAALRFISEVEQVPRGWYAGPVGWLDHELNGEFAVAIRSAVAQERRAWLYAGAGIVAGSEPQKEWAETALKFEPMLRALGAAPELLSEPAA